MRRFLIVLIAAFIATSSYSKSYQIGAFQKRNLSELKKIYRSLVEKGFPLKIYEKGDIKKVIVIAKNKGDLVKEHLKPIEVNEENLLKNGFKLVAYMVPQSRKTVFNRLTSIRIKSDGIFIYGMMPWEYVETQKLKEPERVVLRLFNAKNASGITDIMTTPIPCISKVKVLYNPVSKETDVVLYTVGKVEVKILRLGKALKIIPVPIVTTKSGVELSQSKRITLEFKDADIRDVINILSEVSGLNFVVDPEVKGTVTIKLRNVPWKKALDIILKVNGLGMIEEGDNIVRIGPIDKINRELAKRAEMQKVVEEVAPVYTRIFELDYAKASELKPLVEKMLSAGKGLGKVKKGVDVIERLNALLVRGTKEDLERIEKFLKKADTPIPQVQISARIVEVSTTKVKDLGIVWGLSFSQQKTEYSFPYSFNTNANVDLGFNPGTTGATPAVSLAAALLNRSNTFKLNFQLSALEGAGLAKVISNPKVITMDNREAEISQGYEIPYATYSEKGTETEFKEAKLKLKVTPHVTSKGDILLDVEVSKDSPDFTHVTPDGVPIQTRSVKTRVRLQSGETLVVGGIYEMLEQKNKRGVPYLDRVPLIKWLFGKESHNVDKKELLIFITPNIVKYENSVEKTE